MKQSRGEGNEIGTNDLPWIVSDFLQIYGLCEKKFAVSNYISEAVDS